MIYVKFLFTGWKEVSKEQALNFAKHIYKSSSALHSKDKIKYINDNYIKGIEFTENDLKEVCNVQSISRPVKNDRVDVVKKNNNLKSMEDKETRQLVNELVREQNKLQLIKMIGHHIMISEFENENPIYYIKELKEIIDENYNRLKNIYEEDKQ